MQSESIKGLNMPVSRFVLGGGWFSEERVEDIDTIMSAYLAAGGNCVDTAHVYGFGKSELGLGAWLKQSGRRDDVLVLTKGAHPDMEDWKPRVNAEAVRKDLSESLERLGVDAIDIYLLHRDDPDVSVGRIIDMMEELHGEGLVRSYGVSNWAHGRIDEANRYAQAHDAAGFVVSSPHLCLAATKGPIPLPGMLWISTDEAELEWYRQSQLPLFSWSSQARGFFAQEYDPKKLEEPYYHADNWERHRRVGQLAKARGCSPIQVAMAWLISLPQNVFPVFSTQKVTHLKEVLGAEEISLKQEEAEWLNLKSDNAKIIEGV